MSRDGFFIVFGCRQHLVAPNFKDCFVFCFKTCFEQKSFVLCENGCDKKQEMTWGHLRHSFESILIWRTKCENLAKKKAYQLAILGDFFSESSALRAKP